MPLLFSYGTLQQEDVQLANFGRLLSGDKDRLPNYVVDKIRITDERVLRESGKDVHPILRFTGKASDFVEGTVFELTDEELARADDYEVDDYQRIPARLQSGRTCWIYAAAQAPLRRCDRL
ncbi:gamma-glutamylcyclotransferase family protein [Gallaecimonas sp. GXIMD4217]|uniref:gamma-glutamylcyclotransferase family protein n=1 Tax=Gallaecimonas sp. GXIMD4217 TaxID=3131927 RepID=UPI00311B124F